MKTHLNLIIVILFFSSLCVTKPLLGQEGNLEIKAESIEDWETGGFLQFDWQFEGDADWFITDVDPFEGIYSAQSMDINDNQSAAFYLEYNVYDEDTLSFWYKVSSESNWDYLNFYIDDELLDEWSGEIPWTQAQYIVPVGVHIFKWEYDKDFSLSSGQDAAWVDLITFPPEEVEANFVADTTVVCLGDIVFFTDLSVGPITEWNWVFEGALPVTSSDQNPVVGYNQVGNWDVFLEVSDGVETDNYYAAEYMHVGVTPDTANTPLGISSLCASWGNTTYNTMPMGGEISSYDWKIEPPEAGTISGNGGTNVTVIWEDDFLGFADLSVAGINYCGIGQYSDPLVIERYLPNVSLVLPAYVALPEPAFELTGGSPPGGEYSGSGVSNGWFDPATAGMGPHTITYTYTDVNLCTNSATDIITVTEFIGVNENSLKDDFTIFPNPGSGNFLILENTGTEATLDVIIYNTINEVVYHEESITFTRGAETKLDLNLKTGIYFIKLFDNKKEYIQKIVVQN